LQDSNPSLIFAAWQQVEINLLACAHDKPSQVQRALIFNAAGPQVMQAVLANAS